MTIVDIYRALWRRRFLIVALTLALVAVDAFFTTRETKRYTASVLIQVEPRAPSVSDQFGALQTGALLAQTYARIAETAAIAKQVKASLNPPVPASAVEIHASQVSDLELLEASATNIDPGIAARVANAVPHALRAFESAHGSRHDVITTVDSATVPSSPSSPNLKLNVALGFIIGLILNSGVVLLSAAFTDRVGDVRGVEELTSVPVIATLPTLSLRSVDRLALELDAQGDVSAFARGRSDVGRGSQRA
jgi:protein tyrosine kinase modulator